VTTASARAQRLARDAIERGEIVRADACENCAGPRPVPHHDDYSRPLDVRWLCRRCHQLHHGGFGMPSSPSLFAAGATA
jgi:hypothetical protein